MKCYKKELKQPTVWNYIWCILSKIVRLYLRIILPLFIVIETYLGILSFICIVYVVVLHDIFFLASAAVLLLFMLLMILFDARFKGRLITCTLLFHEISTRLDINSRKGYRWLSASKILLSKDVEELLLWAQKHHIKKVKFVTHGKLFGQIIGFFPNRTDLTIKISQLSEGGKPIVYTSNFGNMVKITRLKSRKNLLYAASADIKNPDSVANRCGKLTCYMAEIDMT